MFRRMRHVGLGVVFLVMILLLITFSTVPLLFAQEENAIFSVSPGEFTARDVPPLGEPYTLPKELVVWNRDNVERLVFVSVEVPPENMIRPGYEPIPKENWVLPFPSSVIIPENSFAEVYISMNIPQWENLTGQKWEVWIRVERQALPGEITLGTDVRMKIETTKELPAVESEEGGGFPVLLLLGIVIAIAVIAAGAWFLSRRRGRGKMGRGMRSRKWR